MLSLHLRLGLPSGLFPSGFPTNNLYTFPFFLIRATCSAYLILTFIVIVVISYYNLKMDLDVNLCLFLIKHVIEEYWRMEV
jgi:hypothetical protein